MPKKMQNKFLYKLKTLLVRLVQSPQESEAQLVKEQEKLAPFGLKNYFDIPDVERVHSMVRCTQNTYYKEISIPISLLPKLTLTKRPSHNEYLALKQNLSNTVFYIFSGYINYIKHLSPIYKDPYLSALVDYVCLDTIERYWDMPCSKQNHHSGPWGYLLHVFPIACAEAERAMRWKPFNQYGIDHQELHKKLKYVVFMHFLKGIFHDSYKIYQYHISSQGLSSIKTFNPSEISGQILDFKIAYPHIIEEKWIPLTKHPGATNYEEMCSRLPAHSIETIPPEYFEKLSDDFNNMSTVEFDQENAFQDVANSNEIFYEVKLAIRLYFTNDVETNPKRNVFCVNDTWTAVRYDQFVTKVMHAMEYKNKEHLSLLLVNKNKMFGFLNDKRKIVYSETVTVIIHDKKQGKYVESKMKVAFVSTEFLTSIYDRALIDCDTALFLNTEITKFGYLHADIKSNIRVSFDDESAPDDNGTNENEAVVVELQDVPTEVVNTQNVPCTDGEQATDEAVSSDANNQKEETECTSSDSVDTSSETKEQDKGTQIENTSTVSEAVTDGEEDVEGSSENTNDDEFKYIATQFNKYLLSASDTDTILDEHTGIAIVSCNTIYLRVDRIVPLFYKFVRHNSDEKYDKLVQFLKENEYMNNRSTISTKTIEGATFENVVVIKEEKSNDFAFYKNFALEKDTESEKV